MASGNNINRVGFLNQLQVSIAGPLDSRFCFDTTAERNDLPAGARYAGLITYVAEDDTLYFLQGGITNADWVSVASQGAAGVDGNSIEIRNRVNGANPGDVSTFDIVELDPDDNVVNTTSVTIQAGVMGLRGEAGDNGTDGNSLSIQNRVNGDSTTDTTFDIVETNANGDTVDTTSVSISPGPEGPRGETGATGRDGDPGPRGDRGEQGFTPVISANVNDNTPGQHTVTFSQTVDGVTTPVAGSEFTVMDGTDGTTPDTSGFLTSVETQAPITGSGTTGDPISITIDAAITDGSSNPVTNNAVHDALALKQDVINDLATIRSGAADGATALQPGDITLIDTVTVNRGTTNSGSVSGDTLTINVADNQVINTSFPLTGGGANQRGDVTLGLNIGTGLTPDGSNIALDYGGTNNFILSATTGNIVTLQDSIVISDNNDSDVKRVTIGDVIGLVEEDDPASVLVGINTEVVEPGAIAIVSSVEQYYNISGDSQNVVTGHDFTDSDIWIRVGDGGGTVDVSDKLDTDLGNVGTVSSADAQTFRNRIGAGISNLALGTTSTTALAGNTRTINQTEVDKLSHIEISQDVNLDTLETDVANNNAKISFPGFGTTAGTALEGDTVIGDLDGRTATQITTEITNAVNAINIPESPLDGFSETNTPSATNNVPKWSADNTITWGPDNEGSGGTDGITINLRDGTTRNVTTFDDRHISFRDNGDAYITASSYIHYAENTDEIPDNYNDHIDNDIPVFQDGSYIRIYRNHGTSEDRDDRVELEILLEGIDLYGSDLQAGGITRAGTRYTFNDLIANVQTIRDIDNTVGSVVVVKYYGVAEGTSNTVRGVDFVEDIDGILTATVTVPEPGIQDLSGFTTDDLTEGSNNLYYTDARVSANTDVAANTAKVSFPGFGTTSTTALRGDTTTITQAQANAITANTAKVSNVDITHNSDSTMVITNINGGTFANGTWTPPTTTGSGGLTSVMSNNSLTGDGTAMSPLAVNNSAIDIGIAQVADLRADLDSRALQVFVEDTVNAFDVEDNEDPSGFRLTASPAGTEVNVSFINSSGNDVARLGVVGETMFVELGIDQLVDDLTVVLEAGRNIYASTDNGLDVVFLGTTIAGSTDQLIRIAGTDPAPINALVNAGEEVWIANDGVGTESTFFTTSYDADLRGDLRVRGNIDSPALDAKANIAGGNTFTGVQTFGAQARHIEISEATINGVSQERIEFRNSTNPGGIFIEFDGFHRNIGGTLRDLTIDTSGLWTFADSAAVTNNLTVGGRNVLTVAHGGDGITINTANNDINIDVDDTVARTNADNIFGSDTANSDNTFNGDFNINLQENHPGQTPRDHTATITSRDNQSVGLDIINGGFQVSTALNDDADFHSLSIEQPNANGANGSMEVNVATEFSSSVAVGDVMASTSVVRDTILVDDNENDDHLVVNATNIRFVDGDTDAASYGATGILFPDNSILTTSSIVELITPATEPMYVDTMLTIDGGAIVFTGIEYRLDVNIPPAGATALAIGNNIRIFSPTDSSNFTDARIDAITTNNDMSLVLDVLITGGNLAGILDNSLIHVLDSGTAATAQRVTAVLDNAATSVDSNGLLTFTPGSGEGNQTLTAGRGITLVNAADETVESSSADITISVSDDIATEAELADALAHIGEVVLDTATDVSISFPSSNSFLFTDTVPSTGRRGERMDISENPNNIANLTVGNILTFNWTSGGEDRTLSRTVADLRTTGGNAIFFSGTIDTGTRNSIQDNRGSLTFTTPEHPPIRVINSENGRITYSVVDGELFTSFDESNLETDEIIQLTGVGIDVEMGDIVLTTGGPRPNTIFRRTGQTVNTSWSGSSNIDDDGNTRISFDDGWALISEPIYDWAHEGNNDQIPVDKMSNVFRDVWRDQHTNNFTVRTGDVYSRHFGLWERVGEDVAITATNYDAETPDVANSDWRAITIGPRLITIGTQTPFGHIVREEVDHVTIYDSSGAVFTGLSQGFRDAANIGDHIVVYYQALGRAFFRITDITTGGDVEAALEYTLGWGGGTFTPPNVATHDVIGLVGPDPELDQQFQRGGYVNAWITGDVTTEDNLPFQTIAGNADPATLTTSRDTYTNITGLRQTWYFYPDVGNGLWTRFDQADATDNDGTPTTDPGQIRTQTFAHVSTFEL